MNYKWIGAIFVITGCGGAGFSIAANHKRQERLLRQLIEILEFMRSELQFQLTPLPSLCKHAAQERRGILRDLFLNLSYEMEWQSAPDVCSCMTAALDKTGEIPASLRHHFLRLGYSLGKFDLPGQLQGLQAVETGCREELRKLSQNSASRLRSYQTLGLCAGAALAILLV